MTQGKFRDVLIDRSHCFGGPAYLWVHVKVAWLCKIECFGLSSQWEVSNSCQVIKPINKAVLLLLLLTWVRCSVLEYCLKRIFIKSDWLYICSIHGEGDPGIVNPSLLFEICQCLICQMPQHGVCEAVTLDPLELHSQPSHGYANRYRRWVQTFVVLRYCLQQPQGTPRSGVGSQLLPYENFWVKRARLKIIDKNTDSL